MADNLTTTAKTSTVPRATVIKTKQLGDAHVQAVEILGANTAFGELSVANLSPRALLVFNYGVNTELVVDNSTASGSLSVANRMMEASSGAATSSNGDMASRRIIDYQPGMGALIRMAGRFDAPATGNDQLAGVGDDTDGFYFGYNDTTFGVLRIQNGTETWTPASNWNGDIADGSQALPAMDFTKGNVYQILYQWLGFGAIRFYMENPPTGDFILVHTIQYANANTIPSIFNPSLPLRLASKNTTNNTDIVVRFSSMGAYLQGPHQDTGPQFSQENTKTGVGTTLTNIITIRNKATYQNTTNRKHLSLLQVSIDSDGTKNGRFKLVRNATLGGTPAYNDIDTSDSVVDFDIAGTTVTGGTVIDNFRIGKTADKDIDVSEHYIELFPGETLTLAAAADSSTVDYGGSLTWRESL